LPEGKKNYTKTAPIQLEEFADCIAWWTKRKETDRAWKIPAKQILDNGCNLDIKNPAAKEDLEHLPPEKLVESIVEKERRILEIMGEIKALLAEGPKT
jgi:type I restriction enzyme M protein